MRLRTVLIGESGPEKSLRLTPFPGGPTLGETTWQSEQMLVASASPSRASDASSASAGELRPKVALISRAPHKNQAQAVEDRIFFIERTRTSRIKAESWPASRARDTATRYLTKSGSWNRGPPRSFQANGFGAPKPSSRSPLAAFETPATPSWLILKPLATRLSAVRLGAKWVRDS
jgi:hypothetical protein